MDIQISTKQQLIVKPQIDMSKLRTVPLPCKLCRTCLKYKEATVKLTENMHCELGIVSLKTALTSCVPELEKVTDATFLCSECVLLLKVSYLFRIKCLNSENIIQEYVKEANNKLLAQKGVRHKLPDDTKKEKNEELSDLAHEKSIQVDQIKCEPDESGIAYEINELKNLDNFVKEEYNGTNNSEENSSDLQNIINNIPEVEYEEDDIPEYIKIDNFTRDDLKKMQSFLPISNDNQDKFVTDDSNFENSSKIESSDDVNEAVSFVLPKANTNDSEDDSFSINNKESVSNHGNNLVQNTEISPEIENSKSVPITVGKSKNKTVKKVKSVVIPHRYLNKSFVLNRKITYTEDIQDSRSLLKSKNVVTSDQQDEFQSNKKIKIGQAGPQRVIPDMCYVEIKDNNEKPEKIKHEPSNNLIFLDHDYAVRLGRKRKNS